MRVESACFHLRCAWSLKHILELTFGIAYQTHFFNHNFKNKFNMLLLFREKKHTRKNALFNNHAVQILLTFFKVHTVIVNTLKCEYVEF